MVYFHSKGAPHLKASLLLVFLFVAVTAGLLAFASAQPCGGENCYYELEKRALTCDGGKQPRSEHDCHGSFLGDSDPDSKVLGECCRLNCYSEINRRGLACGTGRARSKEDFHMPFGDDWTSQSDEKIKEECCQQKCSDVMESRGLTCSTGEMRDKSDWHNPFSRGKDDGDVIVECCRKKCFGNFEGTCDGSKIPRPESDGHNCGDRCDQPDECCIDDNTCSKHFKGKCPDGEVFREDKQCWWDGGKNDYECNDCCIHPLQEKCQSKTAQECSQCAKFAPCSRSIDSRCISQEALDCLPCAEKKVDECAACAYGWDNCNTRREYSGLDCREEDFEYEIPLKVDGTCYQVPSFPGKFQLSKLTGSSPVFLGDCVDDTCGNCETTIDVTPAKASEYIANLTKGVCDNEEEDGRSNYQLMSWDSSIEKNPCPDARPCGPENCVPGKDFKCAVFTIFGKDATCTVEKNVTKYDTVGEYHAIATADGTCRQDGSGRSYYKLTYNYANDDGIGLLGCKDIACSVGCKEVSMKRNVCSSPDWAGGLQLVVTGNPDDWKDEPTLPTKAPTKSPTDKSTNEPTNLPTAQPTAPSCGKGSTDSSCSCRSEINFKCTGPDGFFECKMDPVPQCKYRHQGMYYCEDVDAWARSDKPVNPDKYLTSFGGKPLSTTGSNGLSQCTSRMCIDVLYGGYKDPDCYCACKEGSDTCCKYAEQKDGTTQYGCVSSRSWKQFKAASANLGKYLTVVAGYEEMCPENGKRPGERPTAKPTTAKPTLKVNPSPSPTTKKPTGAPTKAPTQDKWKVIVKSSAADQEVLNKLCTELLSQYKEVACKVSPSGSEIVLRGTKAQLSAAKSGLDSMSGTPYSVGTIEPDTDKDEEGFFTTAVIIGIAAGGGVVLIAFVAVVVMRSAKKRGGRTPFKQPTYRNSYFSNPMVEMKKQVSTHFSSGEVPVPRAKPWSKEPTSPSSPEATV